MWKLKLDVLKKLVTYQKPKVQKNHLVSSFTVMAVPRTAAAGRARDRKAVSPGLPRHHLRAS